MNKRRLGLFAALAVPVIVAVAWARPLYLAQAYEKQSAQKWADSAPQFVSTAQCTACHRGEYNAISQSKHWNQNCQVCHGPAAEHLQGNGESVVDRSRELCGYCHNSILGRRADFPRVDLEQHGGKAACVTCHNPHNPGLGQGQGQGQAKPPAVPHSLQGRDDCLVCHSAAGIKPFPKDHAGRTKATCLSCHAG